MKPIPPKKEAADGSWVDEEDFDLSGLFLDSEPPARPALAAPPPTDPPAREPAVPADSGNADFEVVELAELLEDDTHVRPTPIPEGDDEQAVAASGGLTAPPPAPASTMPPPDALGTSTMRPPRLESEYVADMMERARSPWPLREAQGAPAESVPPVADSASEERFDFGDLDEPPAKSGAATLPPPSDLSAADADDELDRPTRPVDLSPAPGRAAAERLRSQGLDSELDAAQRSRAIPENVEARDPSDPSTRRGIGGSSSSQRSGQATQPRPSASAGVERIASTAPPPAAPLATPRPRPPSAGGVRFAPIARPGSRRLPTLDAPFATVSSAKLAAAVSPLSPTSAPPTARDALTRIRDRFDLGDYSGALVQAEAILEDQPYDPEASRLAEACRTHLRQMYLSHIGERSRVPRVVMEPDQLRWLSLDHRSGFLLSVIDGMSCIDEIIDVSGMPELDTLRILYDFVLQGVIQVEPLRGGRR